MADNNRKDSRTLHLLKTSMMLSELWSNSGAPPPCQIHPMKTKITQVNFFGNLFTVLTSHCVCGHTFFPKPSLQKPPLWLAFFFSYLTKPLHLLATLQAVEMAPCWEFTELTLMRLACQCCGNFPPSLSCFCDWIHHWRRTSGNNMKRLGFCHFSKN